MRGVLLLLLAGCTSACNLSRQTDIDDVDEFGRCRSDTACDGDEVCARNGACYPEAQVRSITVTWTVGGSPADAVTCARAPDLRIGFDGPGRATFNHIEFAPVPCRAGRFSIDKLPIDFTTVHLGNQRAGDGQRAQLDAVTGATAIDLAL